MSQLTAYDKFIQQALKYGFSLFGLPKTGQTTSYQSGDDGDLEKGYPRTGTRFVDKGDGTITDNATGLQWVKDPSQLGGNWGTPGSPATMKWNDAIDECLALTYAGHSDWRLPNIKELVSIIDFENTNPAIDSTFVCKANRYRSSTTYIDDTTRCFYVHFYHGESEYSLKTTEGDNYYARPVRGGV